jgi:hypothetical protein
VDEPIVFISRWRLVTDRETWRVAYRAVNEAIAAAKPRTSVFAAYLDEEAAETRIVHVFSDAAAMAEHFGGSAERSGSASDLITPLGFEVYGAAPAAAVEQLEREAASAGVPFAVFPDAIGGFLRARA